MTEVRKKTRRQQFGALIANAGGLRQAGETENIDLYDIRDQRLFPWQKLHL